MKKNHHAAFFAFLMLLISLAMVFAAFGAYTAFYMFAGWLMGVAFQQLVEAADKIRAERAITK